MLVLRHHTRATEASVNGRFSWRRPISNVLSRGVRSDQRVLEHEEEEGPATGEWSRCMRVLCGANTVRSASAHEASARKSEVKSPRVKRALPKNTSPSGPADAWGGERVSGVFNYTLWRGERAV